MSCWLADSHADPWLKTPSLRCMPSLAVAAMNLLMCLLAAHPRSRSGSTSWDLCLLQVSALMYRLHDDSDADDGSDLEPDSDQGKPADCLVKFPTT